LSTEFKIAETATFIKKIEKAGFKTVYNKIINYVYPQLRKNPFYGPNIKRLKGEFSGLYRYRIGQYWLFYAVDSDKIFVYIIDIDHRKDIYKKK
jgi:mRNA interferase RelE/StbE